MTKSANEKKQGRTPKTPTQKQGRLTLGVEPDVRVYLSRLSETSGVPVSRLVNSILRGYFNDYEGGSARVVPVPRNLPPLPPPSAEGGSNDT